MYFITCFDNNWYQEAECFEGIRPKSDRPLRTGASRTFGYYPTQEEALSSVICNTLDLHEHTYTLCVVEKIGPGIHPVRSRHDTSHVWFRWDENAQPAPENPSDAGRWVQLQDAPPACVRALNFALG